MQKFLELADNYNSSSNINRVEYNIIDNDGIKEYNFQYKDYKFKININDFSYDRTYTT